MSCRYVLLSNGLLKHHCCYPQCNQFMRHFTAARDEVCGCLSDKLAKGKANGTYKRSASTALHSIEIINTPPVEERGGRDGTGETGT